MPRRPKAGRPTKFTPDRIARILEGLKSGMTRRAASAYAGIEENTLGAWMLQPSKAKFIAQVAAAENEAEARYTGVIAKAAFGYEVKTEKTVTKTDGTTIHTVETKREYDWRAALEWIKRRRRADWGDHVDINLEREIEQTLVALQQTMPAPDADPDEPTLH